MSTPAQGAPGRTDLEALDAITDAVASGAGIPEVVRAASRALEASLVLSDRAGHVLAVAARSSSDEQAILADRAGVEAHELRVADEPVGTLRLRAATAPDPILVRLVTTILAAEVERLRKAGVVFRNDIVSGPGGSQILAEDPSGNVVELFQSAGNW